MKGTETNLKDCWILEPDVFEDERGFFYEGFNSQKFKTITGKDFIPKQLNQSGSVRGVLRGLHFQHPPKAQAKLVSCTQGELMDVAVDLRKNSPTYKKSCVVRLSDENKKQLFIPEGFAHGFIVLSEYARLMYQVNEVYSAEHDAGIAYNDPELNISWVLSEEEITLSGKDQNLKPLVETEINF
ncbi:MAG: dTDP-4-dehydrorhamnose 3,5-epimerase [Bacteroidota bacterium]